MQQLQKYKYQQNKPLTQPYNKEGVYNAYYKGIENQTNRQVLISEYSEQRYERIITKQKRLQKMKDIKHKNIAQIYEIILDKENKRMFVVLEWCAGGNFYDYQKSISAVDCDLAVKVLLQLMNGIKELHKADEIHRHVNMENIQFDHKGTPKLSFRCLYPKMYYMSPQDIQGTRTKQNDVFSLGVLLYKMLYSQTPFKGNGIDQQIRAIQQGAKFPKDDQKMFPINLPIQIKNLVINMTMPKGQDRWSDDKIIDQCKNFLKKMCKTQINPQNLPSAIINRLFSQQQFIPIFVRLSSPEQYIIIAVSPNKHELTKFHIFKSKSKKQLNQYVQKVLEPFRDVKDQMQIVPIYENFIFDDQYLAIRTFYDNQGSLKYYLDHSGTIRQEHTKLFIQKLLQKMKRYGRQHNYLTNENILIRGGNFYISYPPFMTKQYQNSLKNANNQNDFIAPQIKQGKSSQNADTWSIAMLKYMLQNQEVPKFDKNGKVILGKSNRSQKDTNLYQNALIKDPKLRKNLSQIYKDPIVPIVSQPPGPSPSFFSPGPGGKNLKIQPEPVAPPPIFSNGKQRKRFGQILAQKFVLLQPLQKHWTKPIRVGLKCLIGLVFLLFVFYFSFFYINGKLLTEHSLYSQKSVQIRGFSSDSYPQINYNLVTKTPDETYKLFYNKTLDVLRDDYKCVLNDYSVQSDVVKVINSQNFTAYQVFGILFAIFNLIIFCLSLSKMDFPKVFFISRLEENNFEQIWNWIFINMALASQISIIYLNYGSLFHMSLQPCLSKATLTAVQFLLKQWNFSFNIRYIWVYLGLVFSYMVIIFFIIKPNYVVHRFMKLFLVSLYLAGTFSRIMGGSGGYIAWSKQSVFGKLGQLLLLIIGIIFLTLDLIFGCCIKNQAATQNKIQNQDSNADIVNNTEQNFLPQ